MSDGKRPRDVAVSEDEDSDTEEIGPPRPPSGAEDDDIIGPPAPKKIKQKSLKFEKLFMDNIPDQSYYEKSYMHRETLTHVSFTSTDFLVTASMDGHLMIWKKQQENIEFVKHFRAHLSMINSVSVSADGLHLCTVGKDSWLKIFDIVNDDLVHMLQLPYVGLSCEFVYQRGSPQLFVACCESETSNIHIYDVLNCMNAVPLKTYPSVHRSPVMFMKYNEHFDTVISVDTLSNIEYWCPMDGRAPPRGKDGVAFRFKCDTDLFEFVQAKTRVLAFTLNQQGTQFAAMGLDRLIRVFNFRTGKLSRKIDETFGVLHEMQASSTYALESFDFGRRMALERELFDGYKAAAANQPVFLSCIFDETGNFLLYPTLFGVKVVNLVTNRLARIIGNKEPHRYTVMALFQGKPRKITTNMILNPLAHRAGQIEVDPILVATTFKLNRFFLFTRRLPDQDAASRDVFNVRPSKEDAAVVPQATVGKGLGRSAILHTTMGDIHIKLFPDECPKTVENFVTHARNNYYDSLIFHRVIKSFMLQTGDPLGDGTGGQSIWGGEFEDEFHRNLRHDRPFTVSMANAGPNTNGSQFFITCAATSWLDNKHTVFGRVVKGMDTVQTIEKVPTDKNDKPLQEIKIVNIVIDSKVTPD